MNRAGETNLTDVTSASSSLLPRWLSLSLVGLLVVGTGLLAGAGRVEFATPFTARQVAVQVIFFDAETGEVVPRTLAHLLPLAMERRLGHKVDIYQLPPRFLPAILESVMVWLCLWLATGLTGWLLRRQLSPALWWRMGEAVGWLAFWRALQTIAVSHWLLLPNGRTDLVMAMVDLTLGVGASGNLLGAILWRSALWVGAAVASFVHLFVLLRRLFQCPQITAVFATLLVYLLARSLYWLAIFWAS